MVYLHKNNTDFSIMKLQTVIWTSYHLFLPIHELTKKDEQKLNTTILHKVIDLDLSFSKSVNLSFIVENCLFNHILINF